MVRSDKEPRRMGLGSASSAASWRRRVGGGVLSMVRSYGYIRRKKSLKTTTLTDIPFWWRAPPPGQALDTKWEKAQGNAGAVCEVSSTGLQWPGSSLSASARCGGPRRGDSGKGR